MTNINLSNVIHQKPNDLVLIVTQQDILPDLRRLRQETLVYDAWRVEFIIIGESHRVRFFKQGQLQLEELFACVPVDDMSQGHQQPFTDLQTHTYQQDHYQVAVSFAEQPAWQIPDSAHRLEYAFPAINGQTPVTRIQWQRDGDQLQWWTLHTYIEKHRTTFVHTASHLYLD